MQHGFQPRNFVCITLCTRYRQYLVLVLRYWCFGRYWYWYWYWKSQFPRYWYWYWYWKIDSEGIGIGIGIDLKRHSSPNLQQIPKWYLYTLIISFKLSKSAYIIPLCPFMEDSKHFWKCYVTEFTLIIGFGIEILEFWACIGIGIGIEHFHI